MLPFGIRVHITQKRHKRLAIYLLHTLTSVLPKALARS